ncbi:hypothetical protein LAZ67_6003327 [Cordylochernes scorpioides]|uniref:Uncharacterized protein n=1 Tax=Cordylochernes scorpioides TaxID=51811 RepID=A0ABY6KNF9_9ARAC|nr:hypothetical protein LAZ67_6003327 [Cordylochernes scorpioides]
MKGNVNGRLQTRDLHNGFPAYSPDLPPKTEAERPLHAPQKPQVVFCILKEEVSLDHGRRRDISSKSMKLMKKNCNERKFISDINVLKMAVRASQMNQKSGRPLTSTTDLNIGQVRDLIVADIKITIDNISKILGISYGSCQKIGEHLNMKKTLWLFCSTKFNRSTKRNQIINLQRFN